MLSKDQILTYVAYAVIAAAIIGGGFYAYQKYYPLNKAENKTENQQTYIISGKITEINQNTIKVNSEGTIKNIEIVDKAEVYKSYIDANSLEPKSIKVSTDILKKGAGIVATVVNNKNNQKIVAQKIEILIQNSISGQIVSIAPTVLKIKSDNLFITDTSYEIRLADTTSYYKNAQLEKNSLSDFKNNDSVLVIFKDDFNVDSNQTAEKVILLSQ